LTVQNTQGVNRVDPVPADLVRETLKSLADDFSYAGIKLGTPGNRANLAIIAQFLPSQPRAQIVADPVFRSSSGANLAGDVTPSDYGCLILPLAGWLTPNLDELAALAGASPIRTPTEVESAAQTLARRHPHLTILATGGHLPDPDDYLLPPGSPGSWLKGQRVVTRSTHGTGCALSSAIAACLARGMTDAHAIALEAKAYVHGALLHAQPIGKGHGPLNHFWRWQQRS
jgi:hydroxymethylpyrimidine/phosphomethylpyrimidine kinase